MNRVVLIILLSLAFVLPLRAEDLSWPEFRGPRGNGTTTSTNLPLTWSEQQHVKWKTAIHDRAWSSPVVWGSQIWITTATEDGKELFAVCVDRDSGKIIHDLKLFHVENPQYAHKFNTYASPTPAIEEGRVYVSFGSPGLACLDTKTGKVLWERRDFVCNHFRGAGSSPILYKNLFILNFDGSDRQYIVALDKQTGRTVWEMKRSIDFKDLDDAGKPQMDGDYRKAFATCQIATFDGQPTLLSQGSKALYAYVPETGGELWRVEERKNYSGSTRPVFGDNVIFVTTGWSSGVVLAIRPGKKGEVIDANDESQKSMQLNILWKVPRNAPKKPSFVLIDDLLYGVDDNGTATCWEAATGNVVWSEHIGGAYSASPLTAKGRIYFFSEQGKATVIAPGRKFEKLAENQLEGGFMASPAVSGKALILRTKTHLYSVQD